MAQWLADPAGCADAALHAGGPQGLQQAAQGLFAAGAAQGRVVQARGMVQFVSRSGHIAAGAVQGGDLYYFRPPPSPEGGDRKLLDLAFAYVVPIPGVTDLHASPAPPQPTGRVSGAKRAADGGAARDPAPHVYGRVHQVRNFPVRDAGAEKAAFVVALLLGSPEDPLPNLGDVVECVGLADDPAAAPDADDLMDDGFGGAPFAFAPAASTARLTAFAWRKGCVVAAAAAALPGCGAAVHAARRAALLQHLTGVARGDAVVAEHLLFYLISNVVAHSAIPIGTVAMNIRNVTAADAPALAHALLELAPAGMAYRVNVQELNRNDWLPQLDYTRGEHLATGKLQLAAGTKLVLDETEMAQGQLNGAGVKTLQALQALAKMQQVEYEFEYASVEVTMNAPVLALSQASSLLQVTTSLPWQPQGAAAAPQSPPPPAALAELRAYVVACMQASNLPLADGLETALGQTLGVDRQALGKKFNDSAAIFDKTAHCWMTLARLHAVSVGAAEVTVAHYEHVRQLQTAALLRE
eukprot:TRINITY_DN8145_c0_g1_i2.p1 TRINITY_DN8145_c0_g1~~TRINITY_DN8145_c0_g1_i2.p1  ORF type:complete len:542 (+),score=221.34 TRINITY_DN8145_c0_g1_i2:54-1628(+)